MNFCQVFDVKNSQRDDEAGPTEELSFVINVEHDLGKEETYPKIEKTSTETNLLMVCCNQCGHPVMISHPNNILYCKKCGPIIVAKTEDRQEPTQLPSIKHRVNCSFCPFATNYSSNLKRHINSVHEKIRHACNFCNYKGTTKYYLQNHIRKYHV